MNSHFTKILIVFIVWLLPLQKMVVQHLRYGTYYIKETKAPFGYHLSTEVKKVVIDENVKGDTYTFDYENTPIEIIQTGDPTNLLMIIGLGLVSMISIIFILIKKES